MGVQYVAPARSRIPPDYYCGFLDQIIAGCWRRYAAVLEPELVGFAVAWFTIGARARRLYVRLGQRRKPWVLVPGSRWAEVGCARHATAQLASQGLVTTDLRAASIMELLDLFSSPLLRQAAARHGILLAPTTRSALIAQCVADGTAEQILPGLLQGRLVVRAERIDCVRRFEWLYFGTSARSLQDLVAADVGTLRLPDAAHPVACATRLPPRDWPRLGAARRAASLHTFASDSGWHALAQAVVAAAVSRLREDSRGLIVRREHERLIAIALPRPSTGSVRTRRARQPGLVSAAGTDGLHTIELALRSWPGGVEAAAARALGSADRPCHHLENRLVLGLFGLLFHDVLQQRCRHRFDAPLQTRPRGSLTRALHLTCAPAFAARIDRLASGWDPWPGLHRTAQRRRGMRDGLVHWPAFDDALLEQLARSLSGRMLARLVWPLCADPERMRVGFPDLVRLDPARQVIECFEIKGPGDRLQPTQRRWLAWLRSIGVPACVVRVVRSSHGVEPSRRALTSAHG